MTALPSWTDTRVGGSKVRIALWLLGVVGEGGVFTKAELRQAFPGVEQADRRMRDLREDGWVISTNQDDAALAPEQLRFVQRGRAVWEKQPRRAGPAALSSKTRREILSRYGYTCKFCGVAAGEPYPDAPHRRARLKVTGDRSNASGLVAACDRCGVGSGQQSPDISLAVGRARDLSPEEARRLQGWLRRGERSYDKAEQLWILLRAASEDHRQAVLTILDASYPGEVSGER